MQSYLILIFIVILTLLLVWLEFDFKYSFNKVKQSLDKINVTYTVRDYTTKSIIVGFILFVIVYGTIKDIYYTSVLILIAVIFIPYLNYINCLRIYKEKLTQDSFDYIHYAITYLNENRPVIRVLKDCQRVIDQPIKQELSNTIYMIDAGMFVNEVLDKFKFNNDYILKLNQLMVSKSMDGIYSKIQLNILSNYIEDIEKLEAKYRINKDAKRKGFYMVIAFSLLSAFFVRELFQTDMATNIEMMNFYYFVFYLGHLLLIILFENQYGKRSKL